MSNQEPSVSSVFMVVRSKKSNAKLSRKFDTDLVWLAIGWLLQEQERRNEKKAPITKLEMRV